MTRCKEREVLSSFNFGSKKKEGEKDLKKEKVNSIRARAKFLIVFTHSIWNSNICHISHASITSVNYQIITRHYDRKRKPDQTDSPNKRHTHNEYICQRIPKSYILFRVSLSQISMMLVSVVKSLLPKRPAS